MSVAAKVNYRYLMMIIVLILTAGFALLLAGCRQAENSAPEQVRVLSREDVIAVFADQGLSLQTGEEVPGSIFQLELNGLKPQVYSMDGVELSLYLFASAEERAAGWGEFGELTAAADLIPFKAYQEGAILMFYIHGESAAEGQKWNEQLDKRLKAAIRGLIAVE